MTSLTNTHLENSLQQSNGAPNNRVLSGMRPTGRLHLGHYHGVLKNWVRLQQKHDCFFFVADWHALTTYYESSEHINSHVWEMVIDWLVAGVEPQQATLFIQSQVPQHAELHLLLSMITPLGWLQRVPSFKEQQQKLQARNETGERAKQPPPENTMESATYGFLGYPLLQSADILMYRAAHVPVGEDQVPHIELTREIARRFNHFFGKRAHLPEPQALLTKAAKMPGLDGQKMSKSYGNTIALRDDPKRVATAIKTMPTDPARIRLRDPGDPDKCPVWQLHQVYSDQQTQQWVVAGCRAAAFGCIECKKPLIEKVLAEQTIFHERAQVYQNNPQMVREIIQAGSQKAQQAATETIEMVRQAVGLDYAS